MNNILKTKQLVNKIPKLLMLCDKIYTLGLVYLRS